MVRLLHHSLPCPLAAAHCHWWYTPETVGSFRSDYSILAPLDLSVSDPEMQSHIEKSLYNGHALFKVSYSIGYMDIWEAATLSIKKEGYSIKPTNDPVITEKFSSSTNIVIPFDQPADFVIIGSDGVEHLCRVGNDATDLSCSRDTIVLTLRLFLKKALQRKKGKKKGFLFNK
ncbi:uncharacterized protein LOC9309432 [Arabidopsis lyrata subsp. lyrata]|uniref:uncharacterized protein LOC9309432 n=1 Tax=Arabidopsis lyrata subsp. lyrata TaxID=81972 RepID=UPI000A29A7F0|nr:uncharacterized protein LOC9309432 [Arabidopsis lyrata subsp. lyrata]|eukprot:XP_002871336.2 uncharacterized protein LOC9309432 [Arabidopsis lyrata subsp. lyrata]